VLLNRLEKSEQRKEKRQETKDKNIKSDRFYRKVNREKIQKQEQEISRE
jgi:hypothetical protein